MKLLIFLCVSVMGCQPLPAAPKFVPTQADLDAALVYAEQQWGVHVDVKSIAFGDLSFCNVMGEHIPHGLVCMGWANIQWDNKTITISDSRAIYWTPKYLLAVVTHEYGHLVRGDQVHSLDPVSIMYWQVMRNGNQYVTDQDRRELTDTGIRPTILLGK